MGPLCFERQKRERPGGTKMARKKTVRLLDVVCITNQLITALTCHNNKMHNNPKKYLEIIDELTKEVDRYKKRINGDV